MTNLLKYAIAAAMISLSVSAVAESRIDINLKKTGDKVPATLYGVFFEEISGAGDGGLYAEMVRNRGFEEGTLPTGCTLDADGFAAAPTARCYSNDSINNFKVRWGADRGMTAWRTQYADGSQASSQITDEYPLNSATPHSLRIDLSRAHRDVSAVNTGYWGMAIEKGKTYRLSLYLRGEGARRCTASLVDAAGKSLASAQINIDSDGEWHKYDATFVADDSCDKASLSLSFPPEGTIWLDFVSLFPADTYRNRPNGLRRDIATTIEELKPAFIRWPGGCIVEGLTLDNRVNWKETIGDPVKRPGEYDLWGYRSTYGFGYHEFLQFCEDIGADGMFVCNAGMSCLFRNGDYVDGDDLEPLIQDALDAIEYAIGDTSTRWGAERARNGHPEPFPLRYVEVGNENVFGRYAVNYNRFHKAIKERYPQIELITALMFSKDVEKLDEVEIIDPHYYETADWFYNNADVYDKLPSRLPYKVYIGEYAATGRNNLYSSLAEAAFLTGVERNGDKVQLVSYAPLLQNAHYGKGHLIVYDGKQTYGRSNYHLLKAFAENRPDVNVNTVIRGEDTAVPFAPHGFIGLGTANASAEFRDIRIESGGKLVYSSERDGIDGRWSPLRGKWEFGADGTIIQTEASHESIIKLNDLTTGDCTIRLKAKKTDGRESMRVIFGMENEGKYFMADLGSHSNESVIFREISEKGSVSLFDYRNQLPILKDKWYDVCIKIRGNKWTCYLDGKEAYTYNYRVVNKHYAVAGVDKDRKELIVKMVNGRTEPWRTSIALRGGSAANGDARRIVVGADDINAENSFAEPLKTSAQESNMKVSGNTIDVECPASSAMILRIPLK